MKEDKSNNHLRAIIAACITIAMAGILIVEKRYAGILDTFAHTILDISFSLLFITPGIWLLIKTSDIDNEDKQNSLDLNARIDDLECCIRNLKFTIDYVEDQLSKSIRDTEDILNERIDTLENKRK